MKHLLKNALLLVTLALYGCGGGEGKKEKEQIKIGVRENRGDTGEGKEGGALVDLSNKGIGPVENVELGAAVDESMALAGKELFNKNCTACHSPDKKLIGPAPKGLLDRRSPEWIMNMILNPQGMIKEDPIAKQLLIQSNGIPMIDQNITEMQARKILEYFRTL